MRLFSLVLGTSNGLLGTSKVPFKDFDLNSFLTRVRKLFKGGNYSREETIHRNTVFSLQAPGLQCRSVLPCS